MTPDRRAHPARRLRTAVVGHAEWVTFARVPRLPRPGEIVHASEAWQEPGGGGGIVAVLLAAMAGGSDFWTVADDTLAAAFAARGVTVHGERVADPRRIFTHLDDDGERTITVLGARLDPAGADVTGADAVFVTAGTPEAVAAARAARVLVATPRAGDVLGAVDLDVLVWSGADRTECAFAERLERAGVRVVTAGADGGTWSAGDGTTGAWDAAPLPGPAVDAFGCGDAFAAGLTHALGAGHGLQAALAVAARCGAAALTGRGPYGALEAIVRAATSDRP